MPSVIFQSPTRQVEYTHSQRIELCGADTAQRKKADAVLHRTRGGNIPISIKAGNAECWESGDRLLGEVYADLLKRSPVQPVEQPDGTWRLPQAVAMPASRKVARDVVFGSDIADRGLILCRTFSRDDFRRDGANILVAVDKIIQDISDVEDDVWIILRNDRTRNSQFLPRGIRGLAVTRKRISRNVKVVYRKD